MDNNKFYVKGDKTKMIGRENQVHTITVYCPIGDYGIQYLKYSFQMALESYKTSENTWSNVPAVDALAGFIYAKSLMQNKVNMNIMGIVISSLKAFPKLKYINFEFTDDNDIQKTYLSLANDDDSNVRKKIYKVNVLEMNLSDMFSQEVIDHLNKVMMMNEIISNSYLDRVFRIDFTFDEYISFMDMFLGNYGPSLHQMDNNICDYFRSFPPVVEEQKPEIRVITNYGEL